MLTIEHFQRAAKYHPDRPFVVSDDGSYSHAEMAMLVDRVANAIVSAGLEAGTHISVLSPNHPLGMACQLGIFQAGCVWVPGNYRNSAADTARQFRALDVRWLFHHSSMEAYVASIRDELPLLRGIVAMDRATATAQSLDEWADGFPAGAAMPTRSLDDTLCIMSTGGTTGVPKGAVHTHRSWQANIANYLAEFDFSVPPVHLVIAPLTHAAGVVSWAMIGSGATHVLSPAADPETILSLIEKHRITFLFLPPTIIYMLIAHPGLKDYDCSSLRHFVFGAAPMSVDKLRETFAHFGPILIHLYGSTETLVMNTILRAEDLTAALNGTGREALTASAGREAPFMRTEIVGDAGELLGPDTPGEIVVRGQSVMSGYYNEPGKTAASRIDGWHRTGDVGFKDADGYLYIVDRKSDMIISGGFNVYPGEVEQVVLMHPSVRDCVVVGIPDEKWGEAVLAAIELKADCTVEAADLIAFCKERIGSVKSPKFVRVFDELPRSPVGKTLRRAVRDGYWVGRTRQI